jgi:Sec-independent protein translocase protein TatA
MLGPTEVVIIILIIIVFGGPPLLRELTKLVREMRGTANHNDQQETTMESEKETEKQN